jgi:hypothetical protein
MIGILCGHGEAVVPQNPEYSAFFDMIREYRRRTEAIDQKIGIEAIAGFTSLLLGEPHQELDSEELVTLRNWLAAGGSLLVLSALGGDVAPAGDSASQTNLGSILDMDFGDDAVGVDHGILRAQPFDTKVAVDISSLVTQPATLCYDTGCTLFWDKDPSAITHALRVPEHASTVNGVRLRHRGRTFDVFDPSPSPANEEEYLFLRIRYGQGAMTILGSSWVFKNDTLVRLDNILFLNWLLPLWLPNLLEEEFESRQARPQRHRLLHGYPMAPLMPAFTEKSTELERLEGGLEADPRRPLAIGILPHPFCNPAVKGCGFCTFPHEVFSAAKATDVALGVVREIDAVLTRQPSLRMRQVKAVYFGGGTANLTPAEAFRTLCRKLRTSFNLAQAEITLEGVPAYFTVRQPLLLEILREEIPARRYRLSMGMQTFDETQLRRMGRTAFGTSATFQEVVHLGHSLGYSVSGDLLFNLPGQTQSEMRRDVERALALGLDHICL